ncbi:hypothetical protein NSA53_03965 [Cellulosimicrobium cellulans]|nr:hypothetical protein [Cellulosimicrobium cellulans]
MRRAILEGVRRENYALRREGMPDATVRDQKPLKFLDRCLLPGVTEQDFLNELNNRVFFHVSEIRLERLLNARSYRRHAHHILTLDTASFLDAHEHVDLVPYNSGSVHVPNMPPRGPALFTRLEDYPWSVWRAKRGEDNAIVELTVSDRANVAGSVVRVERVENAARETIYSK